MMAGRSCSLMQPYKIWNIITLIIGPYVWIQTIFSHNQMGGNNAQVKRFEARWLREESFNDTVLDAWTNVGADPNATSIYEKLNKMHAIFHDWDQRVLKKPKKGCARPNVSLRESWLVL